MLKMLCVMCVSYTVCKFLSFNICSYVLNRNEGK